MFTIKDSQWGTGTGIVGRALRSWIPLHGSKCAKWLARQSQQESWIGSSVVIENTHPAPQAERGPKSWRAASSSRAAGSTFPNGPKIHTVHTGCIYTKHHDWWQKIKVFRSLIFKGCIKCSHVTVLQFLFHSYIYEYTIDEYKIFLFPPVQKAERIHPDSARQDSKHLIWMNLLTYSHKKPKDRCCYLHPRVRFVPSLGFHSFSGVTGANGRIR